MSELEFDFSRMQMKPNQGVMSYGEGSRRGQWSECSVKDFKGHYNERKNENNGGWCLAGK